MVRKGIWTSTLPCPPTAKRPFDVQERGWVEDPLPPTYYHRETFQNLHESVQHGSVLSWVPKRNMGKGGK